MDNVELDKFLNNLNVSRFYTYTGSLTEPPCTPGIKWIIIPEIQSFSPEQKCAINGCVGDDNEWSNGLWSKSEDGKEGNYRDLQPVTDKHNVELSSNTVPTYRDKYLASGAGALITGLTALLMFTAF